MPEVVEVKESTEPTEDSKADDAKEPDDVWMIRDCSIYKDEYNECKSIKARFHQYFIYGESVDCNQWKKDYNSCCKWVSSENIADAQTLIKSEKERLHSRLKGHYGNNTWKKRASPPDNWSNPLPDWMEKRHENSYLAHVAQQLREGKSLEETSSRCSIM